ncbi:MAG: hypothetical protein M1821_003423 [Bathelium mastoideum]|nr:MAG: hypothetical protein M1821_003423 [Bathelium mastoideum]
MSSGFVSGGTIDNPVERDDEWLKAQKELDAKRLRQKEQKSQQGGKSLYETLQANKAAKQEAFEESIKLKNQFRSLDEHEVEFLDSVRNTVRAQEAAVQKQTLEQLELFRKQQDQSQKVELTESQESPVAQEEHWAAGPRKRKRGKEAIPGVKLRKSSSGAQDKEGGSSESSDKVGLSKTTPENPGTSSPSRAQNLQTSTIPSNSRDSSTKLATQKAASKDQSETSAKISSSNDVSVGLGLGNYSSDEDD